MLDKLFSESKAAPASETPEVDGEFGDERGFIADGGERYVHWTEFSLLRDRACSLERRLRAAEQGAWQIANERDDFKRRLTNERAGRVAADQLVNELRARNEKLIAAEQRAERTRQEALEDIAKQLAMAGFRNASDYVRALAQKERK
jgi:hypothetical protein